MAEHSNIEWCDHTFNAWRGCTPISPGCDNCYAAAWSKRAGHDFSVPTRTKTWGQPLKWQANAAEFMAQHGHRQRVFCSSLSDVFDNQVPTEWRDDLWRLIEATPDLDWLLLTKRVGNVGNMLPLPFDFAEHYPNVWIGATVTSQAEADRDIPKLLQVDARVRFLSMEPLLGPVDLEHPRPGPDLDQGGGHKICQPWLIQSGIDWVIVGGESGPGARPMHPDWARSLRDQCAAAGVPFLFKQWGEWLPWHHFGCARVEDPPEQTQFKTMEFVESEWIDVGYPDCWASKDGAIDDMQCVGRVGKKKAGRLLDGIEHNGFPHNT